MFKDVLFLDVCKERCVSHLQPSDGIQALPSPDVYVHNCGGPFPSCADWLHVLRVLPNISSCPCRGYDSWTLQVRLFFVL